MPLPSPIPKPPSWFKPRPGNREVKRDEAFESLKKSIARDGILNPLHARADTLTIAGHRRLACAIELGLETVPVIIHPADTSDRKVMVLAFNDNELHKANTEQERTLAAKEMEDAGASRTEIAAEIGMTAGAVTRILAPFDCIDEVKEAFFAGKITCGDCYTIKGAPDQLAAMTQRLGGATRNELAETQRRERRATNGSGAQAVRATRIKCPLPSGQIVTVAGAAVSLEEAIDSLAEAVKLLKAALAKGLTAKSAQSMWRDIAAAG